MELKEAVDQIKSCTECNACLDICQTYEVTHNEAFSPTGRLQAALSLFQGNELDTEAVDSIYNCLKCARCHIVCPQGIDIVAIVRKAQIHLVRQGIGPLERPNNIMEGIQKLGNAVNGDPTKRWDWIPGGFPKGESDTLLYVGCAACFLSPKAAISSYLLLRELGVDFMILQDEGCCGDYYYNTGRIDLAQEKFRENTERLKRSGIRKIITICADCYHTFNHLYPELLGQEDFEITHVAKLLPDLLKGKTLNGAGGKVIYQDPCGLGRLEGIYDEPREALRLCNIKVSDMLQSGELAACCGAKNISNFRDMSIEIAAKLLYQASSSPIVTSCAFCLFGLNYAARKTGKDNKIQYLSEVILDSLRNPG